MGAFLALREFNVYALINISLSFTQFFKSLIFNTALVMFYVVEIRFFYLPF